MEHMERRRTRGHEVVLVKERCVLDLRKCSFSYKLIKDWNKLSTNCVNAGSVNMVRTTNSQTFKN